MTTTPPAVTVVGRLGHVPPVRYARNGGVHLAYQQFGRGPIDLIGIPPIAQNIEVAWEHPAFRRLFEGLSSFSRYLHYDKRGTGMSDRCGVPTLAERVDDLRVVLDDAGIGRAHLCSVSEGCWTAIQFAATYPDRVASVVLYGAFGDGRPHTTGHDQDLLNAWMAAWGTHETLSPAAFTPSLAYDPDYVRWLARYERQSASPGDLVRLVALAQQIDVSHAAPLVKAPTLVLHRRDDAISDANAARRLADSIPGARFEVLDGADHSPHGGDTLALLGAIRRHVLGSDDHESATAARGAPATVLFTDIVDSTRLASLRGDRPWVEVLDAHDVIAAAVVADHAGHLLRTTGDGILAVFDDPVRAIASAHELRASFAALHLDVRTGIHAGQVERRDGDIAGVAVHIAARVQALADPGEILVTRTVSDLVIGSGLGFAPRGTHELKGLPQAWEVFASTHPGD